MPDARIASVTRFKLEDGFLADWWESCEGVAGASYALRRSRLESVVYELEKVCESPIELLFGSFVAFMEDGIDELRYVRDIDQSPIRTGTQWSAQKSILDFRVDFLFDSYWCHKHLLTVVECDGHNFHAKTKEQERRDRSRDRKLTNNGITVIRYTGSEIVENPLACAFDFQKIISGRVRAMAGL